MKIQDGAFYSNEGAELIHFAYTETKWNGLVTLNLADENKVKKISKQAVSNCSSLQRVVLGKSVLTIAEKAFANCGELQIVKYARKDEWHKNEINDCFAELEKENFLSVQYQSFKECANLHTVVFPKIEKGSSIRIEKDAFLNCYELRSVILLGNGIFDISDEAFSGCDTEKLVFVCSKDSKAEQFARENGYRWVNV